MGSYFYESWMCPQHCTPTNWFRYFVIVCRSYVALMYVVFAIAVYKIREPLSRMIDRNFARYLILVFIFCSLGHALHTYAYIHQYFKLGFIVVYPLLCVFHTMLLIAALNAANRFKDMRSREEFNKIITLNNELQEREIEYLEQIGKLKNDLNEVILSNLKNKDI